MNRSTPGRLPVRLAAAALFGAAATSLWAQTTPAAPAEPPSRPASPAARSAQGKDAFEGYDFGQVVATMETSVTPLQREMSQSFRVFVDTIEEAETMLEDGRTHEAVQRAAAAIDVVLDARDRVLGPMWAGQQVLVEQIAMVRARLAKAVQASARGADEKLDVQTERTLDTLATRIGNEEAPLRKKRLVAHYRTVRNLARIRAMAAELSPDQRKMWMSVLHVLDEAALAHQQVMMGSEVLFAQFEATSENLQSYLSLMETVDGASRLMQMVRGADETAAGMTGFADSMMELQQRLAGFNESVEAALEGRMFELEAEMDLIAPLSREMDVATGVVATEEDSELTARITRVSRANTDKSLSQGGQP